VVAAEPHTLTPIAPSPSAPPAPSEGGAIPQGKGINYYLAQGHRLLDSKPEQALKFFAKAGEVDPGSPEPDSGRGLAYSNLERWGDAVAAFQASLHKNPEYTEAIMGLAEAYRAQGSVPNKRKALGLYQRYLDLTPDGADAPVAKAQVDILASDLKAAEGARSPAAAPPVNPETAPAAPANEEGAPAAAPPSREAAPTAPPSELPAPPPVLAPESPPKQNGP